MGDAGAARWSKRAGVRRCARHPELLHYGGLVVSVRHSGRGLGPPGLPAVGADLLVSLQGGGVLELAATAAATEQGAGGEGAKGADWEQGA